VTREFFAKVLNNHGRGYKTRKYTYRVYHVSGLTKIVRFDKAHNFCGIVAVYAF